MAIETQDDCPKCGSVESVHTYVIRNEARHKRIYCTECTLGYIKPLT